MEETNILDSQTSDATTRRRQLLPTWIKVFLWIFLVFGIIATVGLILGFLGIDFNLALYGLETMEPLSITGLFIIILFVIKGIVSYGLWTEKDWAVRIAIVDSILGIAVCGFVMLILPFIGEQSGFSLNLRLELVALIPYLLKMRMISSDWDRMKG